MKHPGFPAPFFIQNRFKLFRELESFSFVIISSGMAILKSGDQYFPFRPSPDFYYLTGIQRKESFLVMIKGEKDNVSHELLFIDKPTEKEQTWEGILDIHHMFCHIFINYAIIIIIFLFYHLIQHVR